MPNNNRITANLLLRYATYGQWMVSEVILQPGEAAVAAFPNIDPSQPPQAVGIKIGDGVHYFSELPWIQAVAADVYSWAKEILKPEYTANEIIGLDEYIAAHASGGGGGGGGSGASGNYRIAYDSNSSKYILQQYNEETSSWVATAGDDINLSGILNRLNSIERWANGATTGLGAIELPLTAFVYDEVVGYLNRLDVNDVEVEHQFVTAVEQRDGKVYISRSIISADDITSGVFSTSQGGTGLTRVEDDELLVGSISGDITTKTFVTQIDTNERNSFATVGAIIDYIAVMTAGLTGAMHFVGEATAIIDGGANSRVDPQIPNYDFRYAQAGDVILANGYQEYVWTGTNWRLLGDEGSYAIKGSIKNVDIADDAAIAQSKIDGLTESLSGKVDVVEGKGLSTNDFTDEYKDKLDEIESGAQVNIIEHIIVNDVEARPDGEKTINLQIPVLTEEQIAAIDAAQPNEIENIFVNGNRIEPSTIQDLPKSVNIEFIPYTQEEKDKLEAIESGAEVNTIESITINGNEYTGDRNKNVDITITPEMLELSAIEGARYPVGDGTYAEVDITQQSHLLELSKVAATGNVDDLLQTSGTYFILNCGSSIEVI